MPARGIAIALSVAAVFVLAAAGAMLLAGAPRLAGPATIAPAQLILDLAPEARLCQAGETLFEDTGSIEMTIGTYGKPGPALELTAVAEGRALARGALAPGWREGRVRIPLQPTPAESVSEATICLVNDGSERVRVAGEPADQSVGATIDGNPEGARVSFLNRLPGDPSLLSIVDTIAERHGRGSASWLGPWVFVVIGLLLAGALVAAGAALLKSDARASGRVPAAGRLCALAALLSALAWALLTPPFHVPDEVSHISYVQGIVETGELPEWRPNEEPYSREQQELLTSLRFYEVIGNRFDKPPWTPEQEATVRDVERQPLSRRATNANTASNNPPLFYALEAPVYATTRSGSLFDQVLAMRVLSSALGALTVLAIFMFLREVLPRRPWAWTAGALAAGFQPLFLFVTSGVNADALLFLCSAATFLAMARVLRRGLTRRRAAALGAVLAAGALTKPLFLALVPAVALTVVLAAASAGRPLRSRLPSLAGTVGIAAAAAALPVLAHKLVITRVFGQESKGVGGSVATIDTGSVMEELSFIWQLFLPRAPFMNDLFPGVPLNDVWLRGFVGNFGWLDYSFIGWPVDVARGLLVLVLVLAATAVVARRDRLRGRRLEAGCYLIAVAGVLGAIGTQHYSATQIPGTPGFTQARYLLPLLALYAGAVALAVRALGRRAGPLGAVAVGALAVIHTLAAMVLTIDRYYA